MNTTAKHEPVLLQEILTYLDPKPNQNFIDCTLGGGGHTREILKRTVPDGRVLGIDLDKEVQEKTLQTLTEFKDRVIAATGNFSDIAELSEQNGFKEVDGILYDLGFSSIQMGSDRGFSFDSTEKLDMRFGHEIKITAHDVVNKWPEKEIRRIIQDYGEERFAAKIAKTIIAVRAKNPINTGAQLAETVKQAIPRRFWPTSINPATRTFQAIRIAVNQELENLQNTLPQAIKLLKKGGRLAIISFHSLEDRIVKDAFKTQANPCVCPKEIPFCVCDKKPTLKIITKKIVTASEDEIKNNPRARSAKLRIAEKI